MVGGSRGSPNLQGPPPLQTGRPCKLNGMHQPGIELASVHPAKAVNKPPKPNRGLESLRPQMFEKRKKNMQLKEILIDVMLSFGRGHVPYWNWGRIKILAKPLKTTKKTVLLDFERTCVLSKKHQPFNNKKIRKSRVEKLEILGTRVELILQLSHESQCLLCTTLCEVVPKSKTEKNNRFFFKTNKMMLIQTDFFVGIFYELNIMKILVMSENRYNWSTLRSLSPVWHSWMCLFTLWKILGLFTSAPQLEWEVDGPQIAPYRFPQGL